MFNWTVSFITNTKNLWADWAFVFAFCNLIVGTALDLAFHGLLRVRLAGAAQPVKKQPIVKPSLDLDEVDDIFNAF